MEKDYENIYANINQYTVNGIISYDLEFQIPSAISITNVTINMNSFSYDKLDFEQIEKDARLLINKLII